MSKRVWLLLGSGIPVAGFLALLVWASLNSGGNAGGFGVNRQFGEAEVSPTIAKDFTLELLDGSSISLSDLRGKVVMLDFWASWCAPCREEAPELVAVYREYAGQPVEFIGIDIWDPNPEDAIRHVAEFGITYPNGADGPGAIAIDYGVRGIPEKYFIGADGVVQQKFVGPMRVAAVRATLDSLLAAAAPPGDGGGPSDTGY